MLPWKWFAQNKLGIFLVYQLRHFMIKLQTMKTPHLIWHAEWNIITVSCLHANLQVANFQRCEHASIIRCEWNCSLPSISYCWWSFCSATSHLHSFIQLLPLFASFLDAGPCMPAAVFFKVLYCRMVLLKGLTFVSDSKDLLTKETSHHTQINNFNI